MPQLDTITYLSQLFWTFIVFAVFYAMMVKHILPAISTSIKVRKKKLSSIGSLSSELGDEKVTTVSLFEQMLGSSLGTSRELLGRGLYTFLNRKWFFDKVYNEFISQEVLSIGYNTTYKLVDRGLFEFLGPLGITRTALAFLMAGIILLVAMIGAIVLTMQIRTTVRRQHIFQQVSRDADNAIYLVSSK